MGEKPIKPETKNRESDRTQETAINDPNSIHWQLLRHTSAWRPPTDVYETQDHFLVRVEIAGMREDGFSIEIDGRHLIIRGARQDITEKRAYHQMEIRFGEFIIEFDLPTPVNTDEVEAIYQNGFLRIQLPKARPRQIPIVK